jgi:hypothetical protein
MIQGTFIKLKYSFLVLSEQKKKENLANKKSCIIKTNRKNQNVVWWRITFRPVQGLVKQARQGI